MVDSTAPYAATQDAIAAAQAREAAGAAQAAAINAAYMANTLPVLPKYAAGGGATYTAAELADAAAEQAKHEAAFHPPDINYAAYANVPLSQMPANVASRVQEYYTRNPSERAQAITQQYAAQSNRVISTGAGGETSVYQGAVKFSANPFDPNSALGIAWEVGKTGGATDTRLNVIALGQAADIKRETGKDVDTSFITFATNEYIQRPAFAERTQVGTSGMTIHENAWTPEPIRRNITLGELAGGKFTGSLETGVHVALGDWGGMYTPEATKAGVSTETPGRLRGSNLVAGLADTNYEVVSDKGRVKDTVKTYVPFGSYTQEELDNTKLAIDKKTGEVAIYQYNKSSDTWSLIGGGGRNALQSGMFSVEKAMTPFVTTQEGVGKYERPSGEGMARLGAEGYGGVVRALDDRTLAPNEAISRYSGSYGKFNLANLVDQVAAGKAEEPGAHIHWTLPGESPAIQYMDKGGIIPGSAISVPSGGSLGYSTAKKPFVSTSAQAINIPQATPNPFVSTSEPPKIEPSRQSAGLSFWDIVSTSVGATAAGRQYIGDLFSQRGDTNQTQKTSESKNVTTSVPVWTNLTTTEDIITPEKRTVSGGNQTITQLGNWLSGNKGNVDQYNATQVAGYNAAVDKYNAMSEQNPIITTITGGKQTRTTVSNVSSSDLTTISESKTGGKQGSEESFLKNLYGGIIPTISGVTGVGADIVDKAKPVLGMAGAVVGQVGYGYATAPAAAEFGLPAATSELGLGGVFASNPVGWGVGIGAGATMLFERSGRLGLTAPTPDYSVRTFGEQVGGYLYKSGGEFAQTQKMKALELYGSGLALTRELPKMADSGVMAARSAGADLYGGGVALTTGTTKMAAAGASAFGEAGTGVYRGAETGIGMFRGTESGTGLAAPLAAGAAATKGLSAGIGMAKPTTGGYTQVYETPQRRGFGVEQPSDYASKIAADVSTPARTATANWWEQQTYRGRLEDQTQNRQAYVNKDIYQREERAINIYKEPFQQITKAGTTTGTTTGSQSGYDTRFRYDYNYQTVNRPSLQKIDLKLGDFPGLPSLGGGGGAGGGYKKGSRAYVETLGFETSRKRKGAWTFGKRKAKK